MKVIRKAIEIDKELCDGCDQCVPACAEDIKTKIPVKPERRKP